MSLSSDVIIIGGGFYGCSLALLQAGCGHRVTILEQGEDLMRRASMLNQARVHAGFHYPRDFLTACRSLFNFPRFVLDFRKAIVDDFTKLYGIAHNGSRITAQRFYKMYIQMKAHIRLADPVYTAFFDMQHVDAVFEVREYAFNCDILREILRERLEKAGVKVLCNFDVTRISPYNNGLLCSADDGRTQSAKFVFNCTYARMNHLLRASSLPTLPLKHELTELCLVEMPERLRRIGITIMDGPFFSVMPYPSAGLHSLTHVRYTPHKQWTQEEQDPYTLYAALPDSHFTFMLHDAVRYVPSLKNITYKRSIFEIKTVLQQNEDNDGRPILFKTNYGLPGHSLILGGKLDNIYDILSLVGDIKKSSSPVNNAQHS